MNYRLGAFENRRDVDISDSETVKEFGDGRYCPFVTSCAVDLTKDYFVKVCNGSGYVSCHHFAKRIGELRRPMNWLQKLAVERALTSEPQE